MSSVAALVVISFGVALMAFSASAFARPARVERFLLAFASTARAHYIEQAARIIIGASLILLSPSMWQSGLFRLFGWAIVLSSLVLICLPWRWHDRLGERMRPMLVRYLRLYAVSALVLGVLLLYAVFAGA